MEKDLNGLLWINIFMYFFLIDSFMSELYAKFGQMRITNPISKFISAAIQHNNQLRNYKKIRDLQIEFVLSLIMEISQTR